MVGAVLADAAQEEFLDGGLVVLDHNHGWTVQILSPDADDFPN